MLRPTIYVPSRLLSRLTGPPDPAKCTEPLREPAERPAAERRGDPPADGRGATGARPGRRLTASGRRQSAARIA